MADQELKKSFIIIQPGDDFLPRSRKSRARVYQDDEDSGDNGDNGDDGDGKKTAKKVEKEAQRIEKAFDSLTKTLEKALGGGAFTQLVDVSEGLADAVKPIGKLFANPADLKAWADLVEAGTGAIVSMATMMLDLANRFEQVRVEVAQGTGYISAYKKEVHSVTVANSRLGQTLEDTAKHQVALHTEFKLFPTLAKTARKSVTTLAAEFSNLGVDAAATAKTFDSLTLGMGIAAEKSIGLVYSFDQLAQKLGQTTGQTVEDFQAVAGELAKYGTSGPKAFEKLAIAARKAGVEVKEAFDVAMMADTYEGAAELAGKLNAQLGLRVNDVELMRATEEERLKIIRQEFMEKRRFDDLNRREKQAIAEIFNVNVETARKLLTGGMDIESLQKEQDDTRARAEKSATALKKFNAEVEKLMINFLTPALEYINKFIAGLSGFGPVFGAIGSLIALRAGGKGAMSLLKKGAKFFKVPGMADGVVTAGASPQRLIAGGRIIPLDKGDYTLTDPKGNFHAGTKLFGANSQQFFEAAKEGPKRGADETGYGGLIGMMAKTPMMQVAAGAVDLATSKNKTQSIFKSVLGGIGAVLGAAGGPLGSALGYSLGSSIGKMAYEGASRFNEIDFSYMPGISDGVVTSGGRVVAQPRGQYTLTAPDGAVLRSRQGQLSATALSELNSSINSGIKSAAAQEPSQMFYDGLKNSIVAGVKEGTSNMNVNVHGELNGETLAKFTNKAVDDRVTQRTNPMMRYGA